MLQEMKLKYFGDNWHSDIETEELHLVAKATGNAVSFNKQAHRN